MQEKNGFLDERAMTDVARRTLGELRKKGLSPLELDRLEALLKRGKVGEVYIRSGLLNTVLGEISLDAPQRKLLQVYKDLEIGCHSLVDLSRNLFDLEAWEHYRSCGYQTFEAFCQGALGIPSARVRQLWLLKGHALPGPGKADLAGLFSWLFEAVEIMAGSGEVRRPQQRVRTLP